MKKNKKLGFLLIIIYIFSILGPLIVFFYPLMLKPQNLSPTNIPSLSVVELNEVDQIFTGSSRFRPDKPPKLDINTYVFGGKDPFAEK